MYKRPSHPDWVTPNTSEVGRANREVGRNRMGQRAKKKDFLPATSVSVSTLWEPHIVGVRASKKRMKNYSMRPEGGALSRPKCDGKAHISGNWLDRMRGAGGRETVTYGSELAARPPDRP
jgi:hypothetical protein